MPTAADCLRALVLDDEPAARAYLIELLAQCPGVAIVGACATTTDADAVLAAVEPDVLFVDIALGDDAHASGLSWVARAAVAETTAVVLATGHPNHALEAFEIGAVDYLLKPWTLERVQACVERVRQRSLASRPAGSREPPRRLVGRRGRALQFVAVDDVLALQAEARLTYAHTRGDRLDVDMTLNAMEAVFPGFLRVHRNWLVNPARVVELRSEDASLSVVLEGGAIVPVASERARAVRSALLDGAVGIRRSP